MRSQGMPMNIIVMLAIAVIALALVIIFAFAQQSKTKDTTQSIWGLEGEEKESVGISREMINCPWERWDPVAEECCELGDIYDADEHVAGCRKKCGFGQVFDYDAASCIDI